MTQAIASSAEKAFHGNQPRATNALNAWHSKSFPEEPLAPAFPIVDSHHHLFGTASDEHYYRILDLANDLASGHRLMGTVYVEAYGAGWHSHGPPELRSVGEVERIVKLTDQPISLPQGDCQVSAGIVSNIDLTLGSHMTNVIAAHVAAGQGRLRGVRHHAAYDHGTVGKLNKTPPPKNLMADGRFRQGFAQLQSAGLSFDAWVYHTQLAELADLASAFPETTIILNHSGGLIGVAEHGAQRGYALSMWKRGMAELARRSNVRVKIGGMGMPVFGFGLDQAPIPSSSEALASAWSPLVEACLEAFGTQRCMYESNFPVDKQSCGYSQLWNAFKRISAPLSLEERKDLFYRTACRTYDLPDLERSCDSAFIRS